MNIIIFVIFSLSQNFTKNHGLIVFFFDISCSYCQKEIHEMELLKKEGYEVLGITNDNYGLDLQFPVKKDEGESEFVGIEVLPTMALLFVKEKKLFILGEGFLSAEEIKERIESIKWPW